MFTAGEHLHLGGRALFLGQVYLKGRRNLKTFNSLKEKSPWAPRVYYPQWNAVNLETGKNF